MEVDEISERIARLGRSHHGAEIPIDKRDIAPAFRLIRIHTEGGWISAAEFREEYSGVNPAALAFYLVLPFGWSLPPGFFAQMDVSIPNRRNAHAPSGPLRYGAEPFSSFLLVADGISIEPNHGTRRIGIAIFGAKASGLKFGRDSANKGNLRRMAIGILGYSYFDSF